MIIFECPFLDDIFLFRSRFPKSMETYTFTLIVRDTIPFTKKLLFKGNKRISTAVITLQRLVLFLRYTPLGSFAFSRADHALCSYAAPP